MWIVCPILNDVESFLALRGEILALAQTGEGPGEGVTRFVAIDDSAGADRDVERLVEIPDVRVIRPPFNLGHQRALVYGLRKLAASIDAGDVVVTMDGDGEDRPQDLPALIAKLTQEPAPAIVLARRTTRKESPQFKALYLVFRTLFRILTGTSIRTGNYAVFRGTLLSTTLRHPNFNLCYSSALVSLGLATVYVPCPRGSRYAGRSRMNLSKLVLHGLRMLMPFADRVAIRSLLAFALTFAACVAAAMAVVGIRTFTSLAIPGWATYTLLLVMVLSFVALADFIVLFAVFAQSRSVSLAGIEEETD
jgi:hypothetical protein